MSSNSSSSSSDDDNDENRLGTDDAQILASQKALIYKHPLFPVLVYVLERCEQATLNPSLLLTTNNDETYIPASFEHNLKVFLTKNNDILACHHRERDDLSSTIDDFYVDAMQVLRIHLLELDKVNDLCRDFCQRYIACLKVKLNTHNIFTDDEEDDDDEEEELDEDDEEGESNDFDMVDDDEDFASSDEEDSMFNHQPPPTSKENFREQQQHFGKQLVLNNSTSLVHSCATQFDGQTPLSQIISSGRSHFVDSSSSTLLFDGFSIKRRKQLSSTAPILVSSSSSSSKRGVLPKSATSIMRSWLFQHIVHPYPTEDEKRAISQKTNLSLLQVNNWFINARRRILQPMLEASNPDLVANKKKKRHETSLNTLRTTTTTTSDDNPHRQTTHISRYWPSNLAQLDVGHRKK